MRWQLQTIAMAAKEAVSVIDSGDKLTKEQLAAIMDMIGRELTELEDLYFDKQKED